MKNYLMKPFVKTFVKNNFIYFCQGVVKTYLTFGKNGKGMELFTI
jgi:hypothetical protein